MKSFVVAAAAAASLISLGGCATIIGSPTQLMPINSTPSDAAIVIVDEKGAEVFKGTTPTTVTLAKSNGGYWSGKNYTVTISKDGYQDQVIPITSNPNGWYLAGNLVFGGLIGWFIVDPMNGHMYTLTPDAVSGTLAGKTAHNNQRQGEIAIVLLQDVPAELRGKMQRVH
jgi:hypothetical protein